MITIEILTAFNLFLWRRSF